MLNKFINLRRWMIFIFIIALCVPAFGTAVTLKVVVKDQNNANIGSGKAIQVIQPSGVKTSPTHSEYLVGGSLKSDETPSGSYIWTNANSYVSATTTGVNQYVSDGTGTATLRIWNGSSPASVITGQGYYGYLPYDLKGVTDTPYDHPVNTAKTNYQAAPPTAPSIGTISIAYVEKDGQLVGYASIPISANTGRYELAETTAGKIYEIEIRPFGSSAWTIAKGLNTTPITTDPDVVGERLALGTSFEVHARCRSWFGDSPWSQIAQFTTAGILAAGPETVTYSFQKQEGGLGVNTFPNPFREITDPVITNVRELAEAIVAQNAPVTDPAISTIGWWDMATMKPAGYRISVSNGQLNFEGTAGLGAPETQPITKDQVFQVSATRPGSFTFTGVR